MTTFNSNPILLLLGHTHEDIDAEFAHIWKKVQGKHCLTSQAYKRIVEEALMAAGRAEKDLQVYDLFAIPDYVKFCAPMLGQFAETVKYTFHNFFMFFLFTDKKFARYCKKNYNQHQFSFEKAVDGVSQLLMTSNTIKVYMYIYHYIHACMPQVSTWCECAV